MNIRRQNWIRTIFVSFSSLMCIFSNQPTAAYTTTTQLQTSLDRMIQQMQGVPDDIAKLQQQAALEAYLKQHAEAVADLTHILTLDPRNLWALSTRSYEYLALKKNEEALADANSALQLCKGKRANYLLQRASCFYMLSKDEEAAKDCTELLEKCPDATQTEKLVAYSNRAEVFYRLGKYNDCLSDCTRTIEIDPRGSGGAAYYWRGQALKALKDDVGAAAATIKSNELGYVDTGREIIATNALVYQNMLDPVQKQFSHRIDTRHFAFFFNTDEALAKEIAKFSECFLSHVKADLMEFDWDAPVNVYMMPDRESQHKFLKEQMNYDREVWGTCIPKRNALVFYTTSGFGTVGHIVFAQLAGDSLKSVDRFAGIDSFFEKVYGYVDKEGISAIYWGYQNPWRLKKIEKEIPNLTLSDVIALSQDPQVDHQSEERLVAVFLFDSHKLKKYIEIAASGDRKGYATVLEAAFDKPLSDIEPLWHEYLQVVSKNIAVLEENPTSQFFLSKKDFDEFVKTNPTVFKDLDQHLSSKVTNGTTNSGANDVKKED